MPAYRTCTVRRDFVTLQDMEPESMDHFARQTRSVLLVLQVRLLYGTIYMDLAVPQKAGCLCKLYPPSCPFRLCAPSR
jgi:hypothetical protein